MTVLLLIVIVLLLIWIGLRLSSILEAVRKLEPPKEE
jgi:hypothetical protein